MEYTKSLYNETTDFLMEYTKSLHNETTDFLMEYTKSLYNETTDFLMEYTEFIQITDFKNIIYNEFYTMRQQIFNGIYNVFIQ